MIIRMRLEIVEPRPGLTGTGIFLLVMRIQGLGRGSEDGGTMLLIRM